LKTERLLRSFSQVFAARQKAVLNYYSICYMNYYSFKYLNLSVADYSLENSLKKGQIKNKYSFFFCLINGF